MADHRRHRLTTFLAAAALVLAAGAAAEEGIDLMRQITSQWTHPNVMLVMDRSGSMSFPVSPDYSWDDRASYGGSMYMWQTFAYEDSRGAVHQGAWLVPADHTYRFRDGGPYYNGEAHFPSAGAGQGYWIRVARRYDPSSLKTVAEGSSRNASVYSSNRTRLYCNIGGLAEGELIEITRYSGATQHQGVYRITDRVDGNNDYIEVTPLNSDGAFLPQRDIGSVNFRFPVTGNDVITLREVRMGTTDPSRMEPRDAARDALYDPRYSDNLYVRGEPDWHRGDLVTVNGFRGGDSGSNGGYVVLTDPAPSNANPGYSSFRVAPWVNGTWDVRDSVHTFSVSRQATLTIQRVGLPSVAIPDPVWYFAEPSRMAIAKNVLGPHVQIHLPRASLQSSGTDLRGKPYHRFLSTAPTGGAFYDWYRKAWVGWDPETSGTEPLPDPSFTRTLEPASLVREFSDVVNWGLITYNGSCDRQDLRVELDPDDAAQGPVVDAIEEYLDVVASARGLQPEGSTPTRAGLQRAKEVLVDGWTEDDEVRRSVWDRDPRRECDRTYGAILVTDGESNQCNPSNREWGADCDGDWRDYPPGLARDLWETTKDGEEVPIRTWVIGVSREVGRCELNQTAYRGRTDASSPNGDAGFATASDDRLPPGEYDDSEDYAFFTNSADELKAAFVSILAGMGVGDYATAPPSVAGADLGLGGTIGLLASTEYPSWEGHLRAIDTAIPAGVEGHVMWDAAEVLAHGDDPVAPVPNNGLERRIYTWNPSDDNALVEITLGAAGTLDAICGGCGITRQVVDFIRGYDGTVAAGGDHGTLRPHQLGALINSTPAITGPPEAWEQNLLSEHSSFQGTYDSRHVLIWIGTSDGTVRAFDGADGAEVLCLVPPTMLDHQVALYRTFASDPESHPLGQPGLPSEHRFGVANSLRVADVFFSSDASYRTVLFITEGPGGTGVHAVDITHPYPGRTIDSRDWPPDPGFGYSADEPVEVLWSLSADGEAGTGQLASLGRTWSVPALGALDLDEWILEIGAGWKANDGNTAAPRVVALDPTSGEPLLSTFDRSSVELTPRESFYVGNQSFADAVVWQSTSQRFRPDNLVDEGVQPDLNGRLWSVRRDGSRLSASALVTLPSPEPLYYSAAVAGYPDPRVAYALYAYSSGTFYELSPFVTGQDAGTDGHFIPKIHLAVKLLSGGTVTTAAVALRDLPHPVSGTLGHRTQVTAPPMIFTPRKGSTELPFALYLVYDPDATACVGHSYIIRIPFDPSDLTQLDAADAQVYDAGAGTAGGFALAGDRVLVAQSDIGEGAEAHLVVVPDLTIPVGGGQDNVSWWIELQ